MKARYALLNGPKFEEGYEFHKKYFKDKHYSHSVDHLIEEMSELTKEVLKERRGRKVEENIKSEMADVLFCMEYVIREHGWSFDEIKAIVNSKVDKMIANCNRGKG